MIPYLREKIVVYRRVAISFAISPGIDEGLSTLEIHIGVYGA